MKLSRTRLLKITSIQRTSSNSAPVSSDVTITYTSQLINNIPETGSVLTGSYTYSDAESNSEGTSTFRWLRNDVAIVGATSITYTPVVADVGTALKFEVTPVATSGTLIGTAVASSATANVCPCYYVDTAAADDTGAGTSPATAWKTVDKVMTYTPIPDDRIRFKCGGTWTAGTILRIDTSGTSGHPIVYSSYGSGNRPVLNPTTGFPLYTTSDTVPTQWLLINNIDFYSNATGGCCQVIISNTTFENCLMHGSTGPGLGGRSNTASMSNVIVKDCSMYSNVTGLNLGSADPGYISTNILVEGGSYYNNGSDPAADHGIYLRQWDGAIVRGVTAYGNSCSGIKYNGTANGSIYNNYIYSNLQNGIIISAAGGGQNASNNVVYNNKLYLNAQIQMEFAGGTCANNKVYHNTMIAPVTGSAAGVYFSGSGGTGNIVKNNIIVARDGRRVLRFVTDTERTNNGPYNYNQYYTVGEPSVFRSDDVGDWNFTAWKVLGHDANSADSNPVFVTDYTDLHIQTTSPCKNSGETGLNIATDFDGVTRDANPDIGAFEFV